MFSLLPPPAGRADAGRLVRFPIAEIPARRPAGVAMQDAEMRGAKNHLFVSCTFHLLVDSSIDFTVDSYTCLLQFQIACHLIRVSSRNEGVG